MRPEEVLERQETKRLDPSAQFALISAREAWADAGSPEVDPVRLGVDYATGIGGLWTLLDAWDTLREKGSRRVLPMTVPMLMPNAASAAVSMALDARAFARTVVSACASSTESIANAYEHLQLGLADVVIAGGAESCVHPITLASFSSMQALSRRNDDPATASRPYDVDRDGFVMGEGAAAIVMETEEHAKARGAKIYAEIAGGGVTSDSYHITAPDPEGRGAARAVFAALEQAGATVDDVTHINAHATSTPVGDIAEYKALLAVFGDRVHGIPLSATKAAHGHLLGGTGALEAIFAILAVQNRVAPADDQHREPRPRDPAERRHVDAGARRRGAARDHELVRVRRPQRRRRRALGLAVLPQLERALLAQLEPRVRAHRRAGRGDAAAPSTSTCGRRIAEHRLADDLDHGLPHLVQPDDRAVLAGTAERLEFVVPGLTERQAQFAVQFEGVRARRLHGEADAVLGDHDVADRVGLGEEDAEVGRVHPAAAVGAESGVLGDLEAEVLPAAEGGGERGPGAALALPVELGALRARTARAGRASRS